MDFFDTLEDQNNKPNPVGRPSDYSEATANQYCEYLAEGYTMRQIARMDGMPSHSTIFRWKAAHPEFGALYEVARQMQLDLMADDIIEIADSSGQNVPLGRLRCDQRRWKLSKLMRHVYGDTVKIEQTAPATQPEDFSKLSEEEFATVLALLEKAKCDESDAE